MLQVSRLWRRKHNFFSQGEAINPARREHYMTYLKGRYIVLYEDGLDLPEAPLSILGLLRQMIHLTDKTEIYT
jgi:hypothetical protein